MLFVSMASGGLWQKQQHLLSLCFFSWANKLDVLTRVSTSDPEGYLAHPVNAYKLMKRLNTEWSELESLVLQDPSDGRVNRRVCVFTCVSVFGRIWPYLWFQVPPTLTEIKPRLSSFNCSCSLSQHIAYFGHVFCACMCPCVRIGE